MTDEMVEIAVYGSKLEAEVAKQQLAAAGIPALVGSDSAGGMIPSLGAAEGHRLLVRSDSAEQAVTVLDPASADDDEPSGAPEKASD